MDETMNEQLLTQEELAFRWKISEATLERDRSLKQGVKYIRIGGLIRYRMEDIIAHENDNTVEPKTRTKEKTSGSPLPVEPVAFPEGYELHELPPDYTGPLWIEGQVKALYERAAMRAKQSVL